MISEIFDTLFAIAKKVDYLKDTIIFYSNSIYTMEITYIFDNYKMIFVFDKDTKKNHIAIKILLEKKEFSLKQFGFVYTLEDSIDTTIYKDEKNAKEIEDFLNKKIADEIQHQEKKENSVMYSRLEKLKNILKSVETKNLFKGSYGDL